MRNFINTVIKYLPFGLLFQSSYSQIPNYSQIQFNFRFHGVANNTDNNFPSWAVTSSSYHDLSLGTSQSYGLLNDPYYFTTHLFNSSLTITSFKKAADPGCTIADDTLKIEFPVPTDAYFIYVLSGSFCAERGLPKITHLKVDGEQLREVSTITANGFPASTEENDGLPWSVPPVSNYGKVDVIFSFYTRGRNELSIARALVKLKDNRAPSQINITRAVYNFELEQKNIAHEFYDLAALPPNSLIQWYYTAYTAPYLAVAILPVDSRTISLNLYSANSTTLHANVTLPESYEDILYDMSVHPHPNGFLLYNRIVNPENSSLPYTFLLHTLSIDGKLEFLGSKPTNGISSISALQEPHGPFDRGGVLLIEMASNLARPNLTYVGNRRLESYLLPDSPWLLLYDWNDDNALVIGGDALHLVEMQMLDTQGFELGCYDLYWPQIKTKSTQTMLSTTVRSESLEPISTSRHGFFPSVVNNSSGSKDNTILAIGLSVGLLLLMASTITACILLCCRTKTTHQPFEEDNIYKV